MIQCVIAVLGVLGLSLNLCLSQENNCSRDSSYLADGYCDPTTNNLDCGYDGGDCCACTCTDGPVYSCGFNGFDCQDEACFDPDIAIEFPECVGNVLTIGDGLCTAENNNELCGYDGGDCCICTCSGGACGIGDFDCSDPSAGDEIYACERPPPTSAPCPPDVQRVWVVEDTLQARALADSMNCSGGLFEVSWKGNVVVDKPIYVLHGTVLNMTGAGLTAQMDGNSLTQLMTVVNATLHVTGVNMTYGTGTVGGAIISLRSSLTFNAMDFIGNTAVGHGGGIYAADSSVVSFAGHTNFSHDSAEMNGGAVFLSDSSCSGEDISFSDNTAGVDGGALMVTERSTLYLSGNAIYVGNQAGGAGGAICTQHGSTSFWSTAATFQFNSANGSAGALALLSGSTASWRGEATFNGNSARQYAGALHVVDASHVSWNATTMFSKNQAGFTGGAIRITNTSSAFLAGSTSWVDNRGSLGGAVMISYISFAVFDGNTTFSANNAEFQGGGTFVSLYSTAAWYGDTAFSRNSAGEGGAVFAETYSKLSFDGRTDFRGNTAVGVDTSTTFLSGGAVLVRNSSLSLGGATTFSGNQCMVLGGAVATVWATVAWSGITSFVDNSAGILGGALSLDSSTMVVDGNTTFRDNYAADSGGAVDFQDCIVNWGGVLEFENNAATQGGAVAVRENSNVSCTGNMTLANNRGFGYGTGTGGGVSVIDGATLSWSGDIIFVNNSANSFGGALYVGVGSTVNWSGTTKFLDCAAEFGGALFVEDESAVEWSGRTEFISNSAEVFGGAMCLYYAVSASWDGETTFIGCTAAYGGAVFINDESTVEWNGITEFKSNAAVIFGGAVACHSRSGGDDTFGSILSINASTVFSNNTAGAAGGGLGLNGDMLIVFHASDVIFVGNSAEVAGGAVFVSGFSDGPEFTGLRFVANYAGAGGGVFITGSGNEEIGTADIISAYATRFDGCQFVDNWASASGGAIESTAGQDYISNSLFIRNAAGVGGALRLAGIAGLKNCSFEDNLSDEGEGPAVNNVGVISVVEDISFVGNGFNCESGTYLDYNASGDTFEVACKGCGASCLGCEFDESLVVPLCKETMEHSTSFGGTTTLESVSINRGFWRAISTTTEVLTCYKDDACLGGVTGSPDYCREGYEGPYCSICSDGFVASFGFSCDKCSAKAGGIVMAIVLAVIVLLVGAAVASYVMVTRREEGDGGPVERRTRFIPLQSIKIVIVAIQIVTQFTAIANVTYPGVYQRFLDAVNVINFDFGWIFQLSVGCLFHIGIHDRLLMATIGPIVAAMLLGLTYVVAARRNAGSSEALALIRQRHVSMVLLLTFLVYSSVSSVLFEMFACDELADGKRYVRSDYRVECDLSKHRAFQGYAGFMIVVYTVGIPALYTTLLYRCRGVLTDEIGRETNQDTQSFSDLWKPYKPSVYFYEVIECCRRVLLTGAVVFIYPNTSAQLAVTLMIAFVFAMMSEALAPFASRWDAWISRMGHVVVFVSMYVALLLKVDVSNERSSSRAVFEAVLVAAHGGMVLAVVVETAVMVCALRTPVRETVSPKFRGNNFPYPVETLSET